MTETPISQFDNVRIAATEETERLGYAGRAGQCFGLTKPSVTGVDVIGATEVDYALNVHFDDEAINDAWFAPDLVRFVDHAPGTVIRVGSKTATRAGSGEWIEEEHANP